jgi:WXG100 family type VII secretion target
MALDPSQQISFDQLADTISLFNQNATRAHDVGEQIRSDMTHLGNNWTGAAGTAFQESYLRWNAGFEEAKAALTDLENQMTTAHAAHMEAEGGRTSNSTL